MSTKDNAPTGHTPTPNCWVVIYKGGMLRFDNEPQARRNEAVVSGVVATLGEVLCAVNNHAALVEALRALIYECTPTGMPSGKTRGVRMPSHESVEAARAVLAEVERGAK